MISKESSAECYVYIMLPGEISFVTAGRFVLEKTAHGQPLGRFVYGRSYLKNRDAVEFDPIELKLSTRTYETTQLQGVFGALRDAGPDYWGRRVIEKHAGRAQLGELDYLLESPDDRAGALGFVRQQVYNDAVFKQFSNWELPKEWDAFWLRNILVARVTERLCGAYGPTNGTKYLAGLLHDMSWLFLAAYFPHEFTDLFKCGLPLADAEKAYLPYGHAQISAAIAARSLLPERAVSAIAMHHFPVVVDVKKVGPPEQNAYFLSIVLQLADSIADACKLDMFGRAGETFDNIRDSVAMQWLNKLRGTPDIMRIADEELTKSKQIFDAFFAKA